MKMKNVEIYTLAKNLIEFFEDDEQRFPVKVNFYMQKNKNTLFALAQDIDNARLEIVKNYGTINSEDESQYFIEADKVEMAQQELNDLFNLEQEVNIYKVDIDSFPDDISLTASQMEALLFMIN